MLPRMGKLLPWFVQDFYKIIFFFSENIFFSFCSSPEASATINCTSHCPAEDPEEAVQLSSISPQYPCSQDMQSNLLRISTSALILWPLHKATDLLWTFGRVWEDTGFVETHDCYFWDYFRLWTTENSAWKRTKFHKFGEEPAGTETD